MSDDRVYAELKEINERLNKIDVRLAEYNAHLDYHILRTDELQQTNESIEEALEVLKQHVYKVQGAAAFIAILGILAGIIKAFL